MDYSIETIRTKLFTSVLSDTLDGLGYRHQAMRPAIRPLDEDKVLVGRARTGFYMEVFHVAPEENPYELEIKLIDDLKPGEVAVLGCGAAETIAPWGELLSTACMARGAAGCVTDGLVRDIRAIRKLGFPVFHGGIGPLDSKGRGKVMAIDVPIACGGVQIAPGDLIFGDADGVICVPQAIEQKTIAAALQKVEGEEHTREALARGEKLAAVFARYGIL
ncbi:MAG TPA: RraA family protein [Stellaceae bacterium]|jgi:regulator of RNase E activity RraA|nr:RraA family protein [Stellaceae bacterium]